jgi:type IV secretory pathway VirB10-like protein
MSEAILNDGLLRSQPPKPSLQLGRSKVLVFIGVIGLFLIIALILGSGPKTPKLSDETSQVGTPGYSVVSLPSTYDQLPAPTVIPQPNPEYLEREDSASKLNALLTKMAEERLRRAETAQMSSISFQNVSIPKAANSILSPGANDSAANSPGTSTMNPRDEANRQDEKLGFLSKKRDADVYLDHRIIRPRSPYQLMAGSIIPGLMLTGINSDLPGQILGQVTQNVFDTATGRFLLVPQGTKVIGEYDSKIVYGQERLLIVWTRLIFPNGRSISLEGMPGVDLSGYSGLSDQVNSHWGRLLTGVVFSSLLSAGAQIAEGRNYSTVNPSYGALATQGVAKNANEVGQEITRRNLNIQPTLEIRPGFRFNVFVNKDMVLEPYKS